MKYNDFAIPGFDPRVKLAVVHGNPQGKGDYTLRMGTSNDWSAVRSYAPGDFIYAPPRHPHYGGARGVTVVQVHGEGPFQLLLGAPK